MQSASPPWPIMICLGGDAWQRARQWHCNPTVWALVCPSHSAPVQYRWPVLDLMVIVDWQLDQAAGHDEVLALARVLLQQGAELVAIIPNWVDFSEPAFEQDASLPVGERWVQVREEIVIYRRRDRQDDALST